MQILNVRGGLVAYTLNNEGDSQRRTIDGDYYKEHLRIIYFTFRLSKLRKYFCNFIALREYLKLLSPEL